MKISDNKIADLKTAMQELENTGGEKYQKLKNLKAEEKHNTEEFRKLFADYYKINSARPNKAFKDEYFKILFEEKVELENKTYLVLENGKANFEMLLKKLSEKIYGGKMHFSFVSKLVNFLDESSPICDRFVLDFFNRKNPSRSLTKDERIQNFVKFIEEINETYSALQNDERISTELKKFHSEHQQFKKFHFNRVMDFLIWKVGDKKGKKNKKTLKK
jgi:hypothetical protein